MIPSFLRGSIGAVDVLQHGMKLPSMGSEAMSLSSKARYYMRIAMQHLQNGAFEDARETFTRAIKVDDVPSPVLFLQRGVCFDHLHKHAAAVQDFSKCITLVPVEILQSTVSDRTQHISQLRPGPGPGCSCLRICSPSTGSCPWSRS